MNRASEPSPVSRSTPDRPPKGRLLEVLEVRRNAKRGFLVGTLLAAALFVFFVAIPGSIHSPVLFVGLAFVVAATSGALVTTVLVALRVRKLAQDVE